MNLVSEFLIPVNEEQRLKKLYDYQILDTHPEDTFDKIALLAKQIFGTPYAFVSFVDELRVFFKANHSTLDGNLAWREKSPAALAIMKDECTVFYDTLEEDYLKDSPLTKGKNGIRFYAACPLKSPEGFILGVVSVADIKPRQIPVTVTQLEMLKSLSEIVVNKLESRLRYKKLLKAQSELMNFTLHEIKNPLASLKLANDVLRKDPTRLEPMSDMIKESAIRIQGKLQDLLKHSQTEEEQLKLQMQEADLKEILVTLINNFELQASRKRQKINLDFEDNLPRVYIDTVKITDVFHNLLSNAIKYSYYDTEISIKVKRKKKSIKIEFTDQGQGLDAEDLEKLFVKFAQLSSQPTGKETSNGLGLSICKSLIEMHNGKIYAHSDGKEKGTTFHVKLPLVYAVTA